MMRLQILWINCLSSHFDTVDINSSFTKSFAWVEILCQMFLLFSWLFTSWLSGEDEMLRRKITAASDLTSMLKSAIDISQKHYFLEKWKILMYLISLSVGTYPIQVLQQGSKHICLRLELWYCWVWLRLLLWSTYRCSGFRPKSRRCTIVLQCSFSGEMGMRNSYYLIITI